MEPDTKRPRLEQDHAAYSSSGSSLPRPATTPATSAASQHLHAEHPRSAHPVHPYPPPTAAPPQAHSSVHPGPPLAAYPRENGTDTSRRPSYHSPTSQAGPHDHRPGYGHLIQPQTRPYPSEPAVSQPPPPTSGLPPVPVERGRASSGSQERPLVMEHHGLPPPLTPGQQSYPIEQHHVNTGLPNGMPYHPPEQYPVAPVAHQMGYPPTPASAYPQTPAYQPGPANYAAVPRRKQVRATQACNNCRTRKQKCDEVRPCGYCKSEGLECLYREVPPPKTDRHIMQILEGQQEHKDHMTRVEEALQNLIHHISGSGPVNELKLESPTRLTPGAPVHSAGNEDINVANADPDSLMEPEDMEEQLDQPPSSHDTGAQYLMKWPMIKQYFEIAEVRSEEYLLNEVENAGTLRLWGSSVVKNGQIIDLFEEPIDYDDLNEQDPARGYWGEGADRRNLHFSPNSLPNVGGLNPDRSLDLTERTVRELYESYVRNMWVMHPFLHYGWLKSRIEKFIERYSPPVDDVFAVPAIPASGRPDTPGSTTGKRKRPSNASEDAYHYGHKHFSARPLRPVEKSMESAVILLVLALGKILLNDRFLLEDLCPSSLDLSERSYASSPMDSTKPSPRSYGPSEAASSPRGQAMARGSSLNGQNSRDGGKEHTYKNVDLYPGLGYFAEAVEILGCNNGGNQIIHAQAFLLAGLYYGQLGRVYESWSWIHQACRVTTILHNKSNHREYLIPKDPLVSNLNTERTLIVILCWSALQLESDLRAELDQLPPPGQLMFVEPKIARAPNLAGVQEMGSMILVNDNEPGLDPLAVTQSYHFQIIFRLTLNRVHAALYSRRSRVPNNRKKRTTVVWSDADTKTLLNNLINERRALNHVTVYGWEDGDKLPEDMLSARLRAKYYGGVYIILRPYIYNALRWQVDTNQPPTPPFDLHNWIREYVQEEERTARERRAAAGAQSEQKKDIPLPIVEISINDFQQNEELAKRFLWCCKKCIDAAVASTWAFDGVADPRKSQRPRVTNIHGTATAQFSNILVLVAVTKSWLAPMVDIDEIKQLMERTLVLHDKLSPLSSIFKTNLRILRAANRDLHTIDSMQPRYPATYQASPGSIHGSQHSMSPASAHTPRIPPHVPMPPTSAHSSFSSVRY